jgi:ATP-binding cassette subfamily F protein uup
VLLSAEGVEKVWGERVVLRGANLLVHPGDRIGLVGPNGSGKSTFLSILAGAEPPDHGVVRRRAEMGFLGQAPTLPPGTVREVASEGLRWHRGLLSAWEAAIGAGDEATATSLQVRLDEVGWDLSHEVEAMLSRVRAPDPDRDVARLSGGERRRVALARALLSSPDLLLLDEPTNHLDHETVEWLQGFLQTFRGGVVLVTHDRYLLEAVATQIVEVEDGETVAYDGSYGDYLISRAERQASLQKSEDQRLALIAREAVWAARSPAARTTKQKARLDRLAALQAQRPLKKEETFSLDLRTGVKFGRTFLEARGLRKSYGARTLIKGFDLDLGPGDRLGIVGANGVGKSTLLSMLSGSLAPDAGSVVRGPRVHLSVLDQERTGLDLTDTLFEAAGGGNEWIDLGETRSTSRRSSNGSCSHGRCSGRRSRGCRAASARGCCSRGCCCKGRTCCSSTNRRTTST